MNLWNNYGWKVEDIHYPVSSWIPKENTKIKVQRLHENAMPPFRATEESAGLDFMSAYDYKLLKGTTKKVNTGIAVEIPKGYVGILSIRSSLAKQGLSLANSIGVIDSDYRGSVDALIRYAGEGESYSLSRGDRVFQMLVIPVSIVDVKVVNELSSTERGDGGFGSTGK